MKMTETTEQDRIASQEAWKKYHAEERHSLKNWKGYATVLAAAGIIIGVISSTTGNHQATRPPVEHHVTPKPPKSHPKPGGHPLSEFTFTYYGEKLDCDVVPTTYTVKPGDNIYDITEAHLPHAEQPGLPTFLATIAINQDERRVGDNPNLIYPGNELNLLEKCGVPKP